MHAQLLVGPVEGRPEGEEARVLHAAECSLDVGLGAVGEHDLLVGPTVAVGEKDRLAQQRLLQLLPGLVVETPGEDGQLVGPAADFGMKELLHVSAGEDGLDALLGANHSGWLAARLGTAPFESALALVELAAALANLSAQGLRLRDEQRSVEGAKDGALDAEDLLAGAKSPDRGQRVLVQAAHLRAGYRQQVFVVRGDERADEVERALLDGLQIVLGVVALVEDESDVASAVGEKLTALGQLVGDTAEGDGIVLVTGIGVVEERHVTIGGDEQREPEDAQIGAPLLAVPALGQLRAGVEAVDKSEEVGGVEQQAVQVQPKARHRCCREIALDGDDFLGADAIHVVPEALAGELRCSHRQQATENRPPVRFGQSRLAAGCDAAVERRGQQILAYTGPLRAALGHVPVDGLDHAEDLRDVECGGRGTKLRNGDLLWLWSREPLDEPLGGAEVVSPDDFRLAPDTLAFAQVVVRLAADRLSCQACHC